MHLSFLKKTFYNFNSGNLKYYDITLRSSDPIALFRRLRHWSKRCHKSFDCAGCRFVEFDETALNELHELSNNF
jgi:hypothetical protein